MSANNTITLTGRLVLRPFAVNSKSEHLAIYMVTDRGEYLIRQANGNPFMPNELMPLAGKTIVATGSIEDYVFLAESWYEREG